MDDRLAGEAAKLATQAQELAGNLKSVAQQILDMSAQGTLAIPDGHMPFVSLLTIFALACFIGYYVVWRVTPALHSPLMAVTNAISSVIIVGALLAAGLKGLGAAQLFGAIAVALACGQHLRRLHRHAPHAVDVQEEDSGQEVGDPT
jgi:NAD(P) transhydrogenase subunit alpha